MSSSTTKLPSGSRRSLPAVSDENQAIRGAAIVSRYLPGSGEFGNEDDDGKQPNLNPGFQTRKAAACLQPLQSNDIGLYSSFSRSMSTESEKSDSDFDLHPLIKEELRNSIQKRRWQRGMLDWALEDYDKKRYREDQLTPEELEKREDRKMRNREAAAKCRAKRRTRMEELEQSMNSLESRRNELMQQKEQLLQEKQQLEKMVEDHFRVCHRNNGLRGT
ncbi:cyclic AMP-dependent transcription factor ATF-3-like [Patiria miniata]|uniref:BZIP domain-containing protein n=1 Tax=Patiria miniata TaxID=46514 RepID=A0A914BAA8_PATMI|nr:cyclic AMP-dependent transcription factor ATF-3-like [Patiria miniata]XP_038073132.1 cyclic AMP-dependent transcription factor ATF-3-like [Patiria miniata]XP_038073133.1 cyclic AMP-dependent transcription factor ATF-3-like [Patiria miniata]